LRAAQTGQTQVWGKSSKAVPGAMSFLGSPFFRIVDVAAGAALVPIEGLSLSGSIAHSSKRVGKLILKYTLKIIAEDGRLISTNS
jgi:hypothetical protein